MTRISTNDTAWSIYSHTGKKNHTHFPADAKNFIYPLPTKSMELYLWTCTYIYKKRDPIQDDDYCVYAK